MSYLLFRLSVPVPRFALESAPRFQIPKWYHPRTQGEYEGPAIAVVVVAVVIVVIRSSRVDATGSARHLA